MKWPQNPDAYGQVTAEPPAKTWITWKAILDFGGPLCALLITILGSKNPSFVFRLLAGIAAIFLLVMLAPVANTLLKKMARKAEEKQFIREEHEKLNELLVTFRKFITVDDCRSLYSIVGRACGNNAGTLSRVFVPNYVSDWIRFFARRMDSSTNDIGTFMTQCEEFTVIILRFNRDCVIRSQKELGGGESSLSEYNVKALEGFREEFNAYLRVVEQWSNALAIKWSKIEHCGQLHGTPLVSSFERVDSFKQSVAKTV